MIHTNSAVCFNTSCALAMNKFQLINDLKETHKLLLNKLLPEIEQHLIVVFNELQAPYSGIWKVASSRFFGLCSRLEQHIQTEESLVFPHLLNELPEEKQDLAEAFMRSHEQLEEQLLLLIELLQNDFRVAQHLLSYRVLNEKLNYLAEILSQHGEEEDLLFVNALKK